MSTPITPGTKINRLTILRQAQSRHGMRYYWCVCDCGNRITLRGACLKQGPTGIQACNVKGCPHHPRKGIAPRRKPRDPDAPVYDRENDIFLPPGTELPPRLSRKALEEIRQAIELEKIDREVQARYVERCARNAEAAAKEAREAEIVKATAEKVWRAIEAEDRLEELRRDPLFDDL